MRSAFKIVDTTDGSILWSSQFHKVMKPRTTLILVLAICLALALPASAESLNLYRVDTKHGGYALFMAAHPDVQCVQSEQDYSTTEMLNNALVTREFISDIFSIGNLFFDCQQMMAKGYCVDLSEDQIIADELQKMHPSIVSQVMRDGKIYAIPYGISFEFWLCNEEGWNAAGLTKQNVPKSFPEFLDFLEAWVERITAEPEPDISIANRWDSTLYNEYSYTSWLTGLLIDNYIMQCQYTGGALRFDSDELLQQLNRVQKIGEAIYNCEPKKKGNMQLFEDVSSNRWPGNVATDLLSLRMNVNQPNLIKAYLSMYAVNPSTQSKLLSIELLEDLITHVPDLAHALLYLDAEPIKNPNYEDTMVSTQAMIDECEEKLHSSDIDGTMRESLESDLRDYQIVLEQTKHREYDFSPEQLHDYQSFTHMFYFQTPSVFYIATPEGWMLKQMEERFAAGAMSAEQFMKELDRMAQMIEKENE